MKRGDLAKICARFDVLDAGIDTATRLDAMPSAFFARQLEVIRARTYDKKYPNLKCRDFLPVDNSVSPGAEQVTFRQYNMYGVAKLIANYADDLPRVDVQGVEFTTKIRGVGDSYGYSVQEIRAAQFAGVPLEQRKANAARRAIEEKLDALGRNGDSASGIVGFLVIPNVTLYTVPNGLSGSTLFKNKTPDEVARDLHGIANLVVSSTNEIETIDTILLPLAQYTDIATRRMGDGSDTTILEFVLKSSPYIKTIAPWYALTGAGAGSTDRMIAYRKDPDAIQWVISQEFEQFPPQQVGLEFVTPCHARTGGVQTYYPLSVAYGDGI